MRAARIGAEIVGEAFGAVVGHIVGFGRPECQRLKLGGLGLGRIGHRRDKFGIFLQASVVGIYPFQVVGCHTGLLTGRIFRDNMPISLFGLGATSGAERGDGLAEQPLAGVGRRRIVAEQIVVGLQRGGVVAQGRICIGFL